MIWLFLLFPDTFGKGWKIRRSEDWKIGMLDGRKVRRLEGSSNQGVLSFPKVIIPDRAERRSDDDDDDLVNLDEDNENDKDDEDDDDKVLGSRQATPRTQTSSF